jgi:hypothetical protein
MEIKINTVNKAIGSAWRADRLPVAGCPTGARIGLATLLTKGAECGARR